MIKIYDLYIQAYNAATIYITCWFQFDLIFITTII